MAVVVLGSLFWQPVFYHYDDAFITYSYARNLAEGHGLRFHPDFVPLQGSSTLLHTLVLGLGSTVTGLPPHRLGIFLAFVGQAVFGLLAWLWVRSLRARPRALVRWAALLAALAFGVPLILSFGLESIHLANLLFGVLLAARLRRWRVAAGLLVLVPLLRLDALFYFPVVFATALFVSRSWRRAFLVCVPGAAAAGLYLLGAQLYFGHPLPRPWVAKTGFPLDLNAHVSWGALMKGRPLLLALVLSVTAVIAVGLLYRAWKRRRSLWRRTLRAEIGLLLLLAACGVYLVVVSLMGVPVFPWYYVPLFATGFLMALWTLAGVRPAWLATVAILALAVLGVGASWEGSRRLVVRGAGGAQVDLRGSTERRQLLGEYLATQSPDPDASLLCYEAGKIPYFSRIRSYDTLALVTEQTLPALEKRKPLLNVLNLEPLYVVGPNLPGYLPMKFLKSPYYWEHYRKIEEFEDYCLWIRENTKRSGS